MTTPKFTKAHLIVLFTILFPTAGSSLSNNLFSQDHSASAGVSSVSSDNTQNSKIQYPDFNFASAGDFGCSERANRTVSNMLTMDPELVIVTGDLSYQKSPDCWYNTVARLDTDERLKIAFGEHDIDDNLTKYNNYLKHFNLTEPYYSFDYQNVHFLVMATAKNGAVPYTNGSEQHKFVIDDLKKASENDQINWIIVDTFRPLYSSNTTHPGVDKLQDIYHPIFEKYGVDIVLQGHNHNYQRTYPLSYNLASPIKPIITDKETREYDKDHAGQIFITVGTAGEDLYNFTSQAPYVIRQFLRHGFLNVDITNNGTNLTATFYENREMTDKDHFTFIKSPKK
ncbi:MAG TPA: metallophosphoesterase [Nitrososphaeraceae archaeon]